MNPIFSPTFNTSSRYLEVYQDKASCLSDRSHLSERPPSSAKSTHPVNVFNFHSKKPRKIQKLAPAHSQSYYRRFIGQSRFRRILSTNRFSSKIKNLETTTRRSESARRLKHDFLSENHPNRTFQIIEEKLAASSKPKPKSPTSRSSRASLKHQKSGKEIRKSLMKMLKQHFITLLPQKNVSPTSIKTFTLQFSHVLNETDFSETGTINYSKFCLILSKLKFFNSPFKKSEEETQLLLKAWKILGGYEDSFVSTLECYLFSLFVMNVFFRLDCALPSSPQNRKKNLMSMKVKELARLRVEFLCFYNNRLESKATVASVACTEEVPDCLDSVQSTSVIQDSVERIDTMPNEFFISESNKQIIRKVSLKDLAAMNKSGATAWQNTIDSTKNISSCNDSEESVNDQVTFPLKDSLSIAKIQIKRYSTKIDDFNKSHVDLNESIKSNFKAKLDLTFTPDQELRNGSSGVFAKAKGAEKKITEASFIKK